MALQAPYTALQRKKRSPNKQQDQQPHQRQHPLSRPKSSSFRLRDLVWTVFSVVTLTAFARRRNFAEPQVSYEYRDVPIPVHSGSLLNKQPLQQSLVAYTLAPPRIIRYAPQIIRYDFDTNEAVPLLRDPDFKYKHRHIELDYRKPQQEEDSGKKRPAKIPKCIPMDEWQTARFLSCNNVHETNVKNIRFINCGASRCAFKFHDIDGTAQVLKTQFLDTVDERDMEYARKDALALERLTASPYVANIYGSCGATQTLEYSAYGNLFDWMKLTRSKEREILSPLELLKFGYQIATGVADMHSINEAEGFVSMTHNDICCHQFIHIDGIFKLGDFHLSTFHKKDRLTGKACNTTNLPMNAALKKIRAPEEMNGRVTTSREKVDVFLVGNMMYLLLTHKWMFEGIPTLTAMAMLRSGERSEFGFEPTDPADVAMVEAINWSWTQDPKKRPKAREISKFLKSALQRIEGKGEDYVVRVQIPPLPRNYDFSDKQFYENLGTDLRGKPV